MILNREISLEKLFDVKKEIDSAKKENWLIKQRIEELSSGKKEKYQENFSKIKKVPLLNNLEKNHIAELTVEKRDYISPYKPYTFRDNTNTEDIDLEETHRKTDRPRYTNYGNANYRDGIRSHSYNFSQKFSKLDSPFLTNKSEVKLIKKITELEENTSSCFNSMPKELTKKSASDTPYSCWALEL